MPDAKIAIDGHASEEGQRLHNERLAYNRAKSVAKFLVSQGIDKDRVIVIGHGSLIPNEENVNHELPLDRRAEVRSGTKTKRNTIRRTNYEKRS